MSYTYANRKRSDSAVPNKEAAPHSPSLDTLRSGAARPTQEQMGRRVDLPDTMRTKMEEAFGADLSAVKLYESEAVADANATAITQGSSIAFAPGALDFTSFGGQALLGHEISHVVSQARGEVTGGGFLNDHALEARADREGAMAAAGQQIAMPTAAMSTVSAASAAGPMQAKDKNKNKKKDSASAPAQQAPAAKSNMPNFSAADTARATGIVDSVAAERQRRNANFSAQVKRYNAANPNAQYDAKSDTRRDRFLRRFMTGSDDENAALFDKVMREGDKAMVPSYIDVIRKVNATDTSKGGSLQELFQHGKDYLETSLDSQNMDDMIIKDKRITPEMLQEGGLSQDEYAAFLAKRHDFGAASKRANDRLKAMKEGYTFYDDLFDGFDATSPTQEPAQAPAPAQVTPPASLPPEAISATAPAPAAAARNPVQVHPNIASGAFRKKNPVTVHPSILRKYGHQ